MKSKSYEGANYTCSKCGGFAVLHRKGNRNKRCSWCGRFVKDVGPLK